MSQLILLLLVWATQTWAAPCENFIFMTWDGVRREEFFSRPDPELSPQDQREILPFFWSYLASRGSLIGRPGSLSTATVSNRPILSLPGYQSIFAGRNTECYDNDCGQTDTETLLEHLLASWQVPKEKVAVLASWKRIALAVEKTPGTLFIDAGRASGSPPWDEARWDEETLAEALYYLRAHRPRFLYISLNDSDEWGHSENYQKVLDTLRLYDRWLKRLVLALNRMGHYGKRTCLMVATDHGRGNGSLWKGDWAEHQESIPYSKYIWMYLKAPGVAGLEPVGNFTHLDIRPTIESLMGLSPTLGEGRGRVIPFLDP